MLSSRLFLATCFLLAGSCFLLGCPPETPLKGPDAEFQVDTESGVMPLTVQFTDLSMPGDRGIDAWRWDFGDGTSGPKSTLRHPDHVYEEPGEYTVSLTVTTPAGSDTEIKTGLVSVLAPPVAAFTANRVKGSVPMTVQFSDTSAPGSTPINSWMWDFGDGATSALQHPAHTYQQTGVYTVTLTVSTPVGDDTLTRSDYITAQATPTASFNAAPRTGVTPLTVQFVDTSAPGSSPITQWQWEFGDGAISAEPNPVHTYQQAGAYTVSLRVTTAAASNTATQHNYITAQAAPTAAFSAAPLEGVFPLSVQFTDTSDPGTAAITGWLWDFGDGQQSAVQHPKHTYAHPGLYTVSLTVATPEEESTASRSDYISVQAPPTAAFSAETTRGVYPFTVQFFDDSLAGTSGIIARAWDFGDGQTSAKRNPSHTYQKDGSYTVSLTVTSTVGDSTEAKTDFVTVLAPPTAQFSGDPLKGVQPLTVTFVDASDLGGATHTGTLWAFGDGQTSTLAQPAHTYAESGTYTVSLTTTTEAGQHSETKNDYVTVLAPPTADFSVDKESGVYPLTVQFTDESDPGSMAIKTWLWDFGDGGTSTLPNPSHTYKNQGTYTVELTVTTEVETDTEVKNGLIAAQALPTADFAATPILAEAPVTVQFTDLSAPGNATITSWNWYFGEGNSSDEQNPTHTFADPGQYTVTLAVSTVVGSDTKTESDFVTVVAPLTAAFSASPVLGVRPTTVQFTDESEPGLGAISTWHWQFGDGEDSLQQNPLHTYEEAGTYAVSLTVTSPTAESTATKAGYITMLEPPSAAFTASPRLGVVPLTVKFTDKSIEGSQPIDEWVWDFGDGTTSTQQNPSHTYTEVGNYTISLTARNKLGEHMASESEYVTVVPPLRADFVGNPSSGSVPLSVQFTDTSDEGVNPIVQWLWDFGDGESSEEQNPPPHVYTQIGSYTVSLTVWNATGQSQEVKTNYITVNVITGPQANFSAAPLSGYLLQPIQFTDKSFPGSSPITQWLWDFGDEETSTEQNPAHAYGETGFYSVSLTVTTDVGSSQLTQPNYVQISMGKVAIVIDSNVEDGVTSAYSVFHVTGSVLVLGDGPIPPLLNWMVTNGATQSAGQVQVDSQTGAWIIDLPLTVGDNLVNLEVPYSDGTAQFTVTYNPNYAFGGQLDITPDVAYINEERLFTATVSLTDVNTNGDNVQLVRITNGIEALMSMFTDDGDLNNGDEIEGDGVYTTRFTFSPTIPDIAEFRTVVALADGSGEARSETYELLITEHVPDNVFAQILQLQKDYQIQLQSARDISLLALELAVDGIVATLQTHTLVSEVGEADSGYGIWIVYKVGIAGVLYVPSAQILSGPRGVPGEAEAVPGGPGRLVDYPPYAHYYKGQPPQAETGAAADKTAPNEVKSNKAYVLNSVYPELGHQNLNLLSQVFQDNCFTGIYVYDAQPGKGSVENFKNLGDYGAILLMAHADSFFNGIENWWEPEFDWDGWFGQVILNANMALSLDVMRDYEDDLKKGRLVLFGDRFGVAPTFIKKYSNAFPNSIAWIGGCRSTFNDSLAKVFLDKGAGAFLGYDDYVHADFAAGTAFSLFQSMSGNENSLAEVFQTGQQDVPKAPEADKPAEFEIYGDTSVALGKGRTVQDPSFESNSITQSWSTEGDARIIPSLGSTTPTDGTFMAVISTGLGFTVASGSLWQEFCLDENATTIAFDWNFFSEEFMEWVGSSFQDAFTATLTDTNDPANTITLIDYAIDDLQNQVYPVQVDFTGGDSTNYATGWLTREMDIPVALQGKRVNLEFHTTDVGDSAFDTVVLIDNIIVGTAK